MERETTTLKTPIKGHEVTIKTYITGREKRALTNVFLQSKSLNFDMASQNVSGIDYTIIDEAQNVGWKTVLVSVDGKKDGDTLPDGSTFSIVEAVLDMQEKDFDFIVSEVNKITSGDEEKKTI